MSKPKRTLAEAATEPQPVPLPEPQAEAPPPPTGLVPPVEASPLELCDPAPPPPGAEAQPPLEPIPRQYVQDGYECPVHHQRMNCTGRSAGYRYYFCTECGQTWRIPVSNEDLRRQMNQLRGGDPPPMPR